MICVRTWIGLLLLLLCCPAVPLAQQLVFESTPAWVKDQPFALPEKIPENEIRNGIYHLLVDNQFHLAYGQAHAYHHIVKKVVDEEGVAHASQIFITFNPAFEQLSIHFARIHRGITAINGLDLGNINLLQREQDLERRIYNGRITAAIILEGTLPGDIIEYGYTVSGANPVFGGQYVQDKYLAWNVPIQRIHYRFHYQDDRPVYLKYHNLSWSPRIERSDHDITYTFERDNVKAILSDGDLPTWYYPYPWIQVSQFKEWYAVNQWAESLYSLPETISPELEEAIQSVADQSASSAEIIANALCMVQNDIRYLGIEMGSGSHQPTDPSVTFKRKFGDCKDKTVLLCTILTRLGIEARPALVNTKWGPKLDDLQPSPLAFNHAIVQVKAGGTDYWLDPTSDCQQTHLDDQYQARYGQALVVGGNDSGLTGMGELVLKGPEKRIEEYYDLSRGVGQTVRYHVRSIHQGREADAVRYQIKSAGREQTMKVYLNFYATDFPGIRIDRPLTITDDPTTNTVTVDEYYEIPGFWSTADPAGRRFAKFNARELTAWLKKPATTVRTMPIGIVHPLHIQQRTEVLLPKEWQISPARFTEANRIFSFDYAIGYGDRKLTLTYDYRTHTDAVATTETAAYLTALERVKNELGYAIYAGAIQAGSEPEETSGLGWLFISAGIVIALAAGFFTYRYEPPHYRIANRETPIRRLQGIGGWLILTLVFLVAKLLISMDALAGWLPYLNQHYWDAATDALDPAWATLGCIVIGGEAMINTIYVTLSIVLLILFFQKRKSFPRLFIAVQLAYLLFLASEALVVKGLLVQTDGAGIDAMKTLLPAALQTLAWIAYMLRSQRVRQTFTVRRGSHHSDDTDYRTADWPNQHGFAAGSVIP